MTIEELVKAIAGYVAAHSETESAFLTPYPETTTDSHALLDFISDKSGISKEQIGRWCEEANNG
jgi:hypothetical protein